jgi:glucosamine-6-phosphate deaminase
VADFNDAQLVKIVELDQACRQQQVNDGCFPTIGLVPTHAITLTIPALMAARYVYCMVPGPTKAEAVFNTLHRDIVEQYPSTILRRHDNAVLYLDGLSSAQILY